MVENNPDRSAVESTVSQAPSHMTSRPSTAAPILAVLAIVILPLGAYVGGYFALGKYVEWRTGAGHLATVERNYPAAWLSTIYHPAAKVETWLRRDINVRTSHGS